ncbi:MAG: carbohydrate ABC transporter permease [Clostridia bacterium]|nr:carbohydrate ABC transporter permease [Clostridia bacterium]
MKTKKRISNIITMIFLLAVALFALFPIIYTVVSSFKTNSELLSSPETFWPKEFTVDNYIQAWQSENFKVGMMLFYSIAYTGVYVFATIMTSSMAGYAFARGKFFLKKLWLALFSATMFIHIVGVGVYPTFEVLGKINLTSSIWSLMLVRVFSVNIVNIYITRSFIQQLPYSLDEAAKMDGLGFGGILFRIIIPLMKPTLATIGLLAFQASWNEYMLPTIFTINHPEQRTLIVGITALKSTGEAAASWNLMLAGTVIALVPVLIFYLFGNRYFISGLAAGAVKG